MSKRSKRNDKRKTSSIPDDYLGYSRIRRYSVPGRVHYFTTYLPVPVAKVARTKIYSYPYPKQVRLKHRTIRVPLIRRRNLVKTKIAIRLPRRLPLVRGSYVSLADGRLNIHSKYKLERMINHAREFNTRRYSEHKANKRKARYGQLDSGGSQRFGSVAEAYRRGNTIDKIAEAALAVRAISQGRR